jgi:outer membrane biogenesis lipoprotein LolB
MSRNENRNVRNCFKFSEVSIHISIILLIPCFFLCSCAGLIGRAPEKATPAIEIETQGLIAAIQSNNDTLETFKGIGKIKLSKKGKIQGARIYWIGSDPGKLRLEILAITGQPIASLASDGEWVYLNIHDRQRYYRKRTTDANLKNIVSIPVKSSDVLDFLAGRIPVRGHNHATVVKNESGAGYILLLKKGSKRVLERIYLDEPKKVVQKVEVLNINGSLGFRAIFEKMQIIDGYNVPLVLKIVNDEGVNFQLNVEKYWANVPISPSVFELRAPDDK